jgi:hypothetical protein
MVIEPKSLTACPFFPRGSRLARQSNGIARWSSPSFGGRGNFVSLVWVSVREIPASHFRIGSLLSGDTSQCYRLPGSRFRQWLALFLGFQVPGKLRSVTLSPGRCPYCLICLYEIRTFREDGGGAHLFLRSPPLSLLHADFLRRRLSSSWLFRWSDHSLLEFSPKFHLR